MSNIYFAHEDFGIIEVEAEIASTGRQARVESLSILGWSRIKKRARSVADGYGARAWFETRDEAERALKQIIKESVVNSKIEFENAQRDFEIVQARWDAVRRGVKFRFVPAGRAAKLSNFSANGGRVGRGPMVGEVE